ncbi:MAG: hypothetical protein HKM24_03020 [Gammaproteobacteria bacterium]|nr:hypothetical protein [Gammaproteobacteria bacterium]
MTETLAARKIAARIQQHGPMPFVDVMASALYDLEHGYYTRVRDMHDPIWGKAGDYTTAPQMSPLYARCLVEFWRQVSAQIQGATLTELGAGDGQFAIDFLLALAELKLPPPNYRIIEISPALRELQLARLIETKPPGWQQVTWFEPDQAPAAPGMLLANEVLDALPVVRFVHTPDSKPALQEVCVDWQANQFVERLLPPQSSHQSALDHLAACHSHDWGSGYCSEFAPGLKSFIDQCQSYLSTGVMLFVDYGTVAEDYYSSQRSRGTFSCFHEHHNHEQAYRQLGEQDMTAWVDFDAVADAAGHDWSVYGYTTQAHFLIALGLLDHAQTMIDCDVKQAVTTSDAVKTYTLPGEMGERMKVMALVNQPLRDNQVVLPGFSERDFSARLATNKLAKSKKGSF